MRRVGILALQGAFAEHGQFLRKLGVQTVEVRTQKHLDTVDALIIPGGESTTISRLIRSAGLFEPLADFVLNHPTWGTCAGAILLARHIEGEAAHLGVMDISVRRNAFGRQRDSFIRPISMNSLIGGPFEAVFIRAPMITDCGPEVQILATLGGAGIVAARQGHMMVTTFHPELTRDLRIHQYFLQLEAASMAQ